MEHIWEISEAKQTLSRVEGLAGGTGTKNFFPITHSSQLIPEYFFSTISLFTVEAKLIFICLKGKVELHVVGNAMN